MKEKISLLCLLQSQNEISIVQNKLKKFEIDVQLPVIKISKIENPVKDFLKKRWFFGWKMRFSEKAKNVFQKMRQLFSD